jgi:fibronectin-binding autotransporter adhesin
MEMREGTRRVSRGLCAAMSAAVLAGSCAQVRAADYFWTGADATSTFDDPNNWSPGIGFPGSGGGTFDTATFGTTITSPQPSLDISDSIGELIFQAAWTLGTTSSANVLTLNAAPNGFGIDASAQTSGTTDIQANLMVGAAQTWAVGSGGTLQIDGVITGSSALSVGTPTATGTVVLTAVSNAFTGAVTIASGSKLQLGSGASGGDGIVGGPINFTDSTSTLTFNESAAETYAGVLTGPAGSTLNNNSTGALTFTALSASFLGNTNIADGATLKLGNGAGSATDGMLGGPITLATSNSVLTFNDVSAQTYPGAITGPASSTVNDNGTGVLTFNGSSTNFLGTAKIAGGATLQLGDGTTPGILADASTIALASGTAPVSTLTFNEPSALSYGGTITGPTGSVINISGPATGVVTTLTHLNTGFNGTASVLAKQTLQLGDGTTNGTLGASSTIALAAATSNVTFNNATALTYGGKISGPTGSTANFNGAATLTLSAPSTGFSGTVNIGGSANATGPTTATLQLGTGVVGGDAVFGNSSNIVMVTPGSTAVTDAYVTFNESSAETYNGNITFPTSGNNVPNMYIVGSGALTLGGTIAMNSEGQQPFVNFEGTGPVTLSGPITEPSTGNAFFISSNTGSVTFSNTNVITKGHYYAGGITLSGTPISGVTWNLTNSGSIGNASTLVSPDAEFFTNDNNDPNPTSTVPFPVTFNIAGSISTFEYVLGFEAGPVAMNLGTATGTAKIDAFDVFLGLQGATTGNNAGPIYAGLNVGAHATVVNPSAAAGYTWLLGFSAGTYGYMSVANGGAVTLTQATAATVANVAFIGNSGNGVLEVGTLNGSVSSTGTFTIALNDAGTSHTPGFILNQGGGAATASEAAELNVYAGGTVTYTPFALNGTTIASGDTSFNANSLAGQLAVFNLIGGTLNDKGTNSSLTISTKAGATGILNLAADANHVQGKLIVSFVRASVSDTLAFVNFNGGELEYANNNGTNPQGTFINSNVAGGVFVYPGGAIVGTNASGNAPVNVTIPVALNAPAGSGVGNIMVTANSGYSSPPIVEITSGGGSDATAVAVLSGGQITIVVTNPGFGYTSPPTVNLTADGATTPATATAVLVANTNTGGLTKVDTGTLILSVANTYGGPTLINAGTLQFNGATNATNAVTVLTTTTGNAAQLSVANATTNNNIASAATILIGDVAGSVSTPNTGTFTISSAAANGFVLNSSAVSGTAGQTLAGFGKVSGTSTFGLTVGNQSVISPGTGSDTAVQSLTATPGSFTTSGTSTATFNTIKGNATTTATGALTLTSGNSASPMNTTFNGGGTYYWKLNMNAGGSSAAQTATTDITGANWDALVVDSLVAGATLSGTNAFTIQAVGFNGPAGTAVSYTTGTSGNGISNSSGATMGTTPYSWTIARVGVGTSAPDLSGVLANLSLNTAGLPATSPGFSYFLTTQADANPNDTDLVIAYASTPEPSALLLLAPAAGLLARRRRKLVAI